MFEHISQICIVLPENIIDTPIAICPCIHAVTNNTIKHHKQQFIQNCHSHLLNMPCNRVKTWFPAHCSLHVNGMHVETITKWFFRENHRDGQCPMTNQFKKLYHELWEKGRTNQCM